MDFDWLFYICDAHCDAEQMGQTHTCVYTSSSLLNHCYCTSSAAGYLTTTWLYFISFVFERKYHQDATVYVPGLDHMNVLCRYVMPPKAHHFTFSLNNFDGSPVWIHLINWDTSWLQMLFCSPSVLRVIFQMLFLMNTFLNPFHVYITASNLSEKNIFFLHFNLICRE